MLTSKAVIISDGIPTILESIRFLNEKGFKNEVLCISLRTKNQILKYSKNTNLEIKPFYKFRKKDLKKILIDSEIVVFSESNSSISSQFLIGFILKENIKCNVNLLMLYPFQIQERNLLHFLNYPVGYKNNIKTKLKLFIKIILFKIFNLQFKLLSLSGCNATSIVPAYKKLNNLKTTKIIREYKSPIINSCKKVVYFHSGDVEESLYCDSFLKEFKFILENILSKLDFDILYIKLHPNSAKNSTKDILEKTFKNSFKIEFIKDELDYSSDLLLTLISSAIFRFDCFRSISLLNLLEDKFNYKNNVHPNYQLVFNESYKFFGKPSHIFMPKNLDTLLEKIKNHF